MAGPAFEIELLLAGGVTVPITLPESAVESSREPAVRTAVGTGDRPGLRRGAVEIIYGALTRNEDRPIVVEDGESTWLIPAHALIAAKLHDPTDTDRQPSIGFRPDRYAMSSESH